MGSHSPLVNWINFFCHALGQGSLVLSSLGRCHVAEVGTACAGLGELGRGHLLHLPVQLCFRPGSLMVLAPCTQLSRPFPLRCLQGIWWFGDLFSLSHPKSLRTLEWKHGPSPSISSLPVSYSSGSDIPLPGDHFIWFPYFCSVVGGESHCCWGVWLREVTPSLLTLVGGGSEMGVLLALEEKGLEFWAWFPPLCEFIILHLPGPHFSHLQTGERRDRIRRDKLDC